jgi:diaminopimelate epimerase
MNNTRASFNTTDIGMRNGVAFTKMQALGNDFVFVDERDLAAIPASKQLLQDLPLHGALLARAVCDRHFGIGADGLIVVRKAQDPQCAVSWLYLNSDGSQSAMCGNGLRCLALYSVENGLVNERQFKVETAVGAVGVSMIDSDCITSDLGEPTLSSAGIPVAVVAAAGNTKEVVRHSLQSGKTQFNATCVGLGNPHCVIFESPVAADERALLAPQIQALPFFPEGVNVEFVDVLSPAEARVFVWERGCGPTLACASGAAAVLVAGVLEGRLSRQATIRLPGGALLVSWSEDDRHVRITGPARTMFKGAFDLERYYPGSQS